ncbi:hypothetical protein [Pseudomonas kribbensis]|uniref:Uncharacterized protein n=1 Tax=Pseudomonas kribbensis TaxID=1628086 RepID=A0A4Y8VFR0_9PSED|nr:hypothetical protein [Pseudomonas kribbensis]TFH79560.1 hypothetical protein E4J90_17225 [Pseudomonas kribbensis]
MNNVSRFLTAIAFSFAGVAAHANSVVEQSNCAGSTCFQLSPVAKQGSDALIAADGASHTPQGQMVAADGSSHTPQGQMVAENGASRTPQSQWLDSQNA